MLRRGSSLAVGFLLLAAASCSASPMPHRDQPAAGTATSVRPPTPPPPTWPQRLEGRSAHFDSVDAALTYLRRTMDVPIRLPRHLPSGDFELEEHGVYLRTLEGRRNAQFDLLFASGEQLILQYGVSILDGCAPEVSVPVQIEGQPGRLRSSDGGRWSELIWPATLAHPAGVYGLSGPFSRHEIIAMAESMPRLTTTPLLDLGC